MTRTPEPSVENITDIILKAKEEAYRETDFEPEPELTTQVDWPVQCTVGPGLEGAIACETKIGYVNGSKGMLIYRGYDIFDLCAHCSFEEVSYLLHHGRLPTEEELAELKGKLAQYRHLLETKRLLMTFPIENMNTMAALRLGTNLMRQKQTFRDTEDAQAEIPKIATDEDSIPMETRPMGHKDSVYGFDRKQYKQPKGANKELLGGEELDSCYRLIAGLSSIAATIARIRYGRLPLEPKPELGHAANLLFMMTGRVPSPLEEKVMDVALILHADHGMNASTFAALVVASTLSDIYFSVGSGIAALNGPLHGGANEQVIRMLAEIGDENNVDEWFRWKMDTKQKISGFGHRVYKAYDPRARVLGPLAELLVRGNPGMREQFKTAMKLEDKVISTLGAEKKIFPNVDFYSGIVYGALGIPMEMFTPIFAVARVAGWTARILEYLEKNRIFRPRAIYTGDFDKRFVPLDQRR
ncbi:MAG: citrate/2-methylcitrate synthase [Spirochaetia bacterium]